MLPAVPSQVLAWLRSATPDDPAVAEVWVPGASLAERQALQRLGGLARTLLPPNSDRSRLPPEVTRWLDAGHLPTAPIVDEFREALTTAPDRTLAEVYATVVCGRNRRRLGTFFTPPDEVRVLLDRWSATQEAPTHIVDVGAGVGVFTVAASGRWPTARLHAIDVNPVTLGLLAVRMLAAQDHEAAHAATSTKLVLDDYLRWLDDAWPQLHGPRLILGNPPYTRSALLPRENRASVLASGHGLTGTRASLSSVITAASLIALKEQDGLCLLLPAQWLESRYAKGLREQLWNLKSRRVELRLFRSGLFAGAQVDAVMLLVGAEGKSPGFYVAYDATAPQEVDTNGETPAGWHSMVAGGEAEHFEDETISLGSIATVRRGTATGANSFFVLSDEDATKLEPEFRTRVIRRLTGVSDTLDDRVFDAELKMSRTWLLLATREQRRRSVALDSYIQGGEMAGLADRVLCAARGSDHWFDLHHDIVRPDVVIGAMTKEVFRVVENLSKAAITNNLYGWSWDHTVSLPARKRILAWLRGPEGQARLRAAARRQGGGLLKIEPRALKELRLPLSIVGRGLE